MQQRIDYVGFAWGMEVDMGQESGCARLPLELGWDCKKCCRPCHELSASGKEAGGGGVLLGGVVLQLCCCAWSHVAMQLPSELFVLPDDERLPTTAA